MGSRIDLTGQRFGRLTVLERVVSERPKRGAPARWRCKCDCSQEVVVVSQSLRAGHTKSCGCLNRESRISSRLIDLQGQRFGRLVVLRRVDGERRKRGFWVCQCECGNVAEVYGANLRAGLTQSCGCWNIDALRSRSGERHPNWRGGKSVREGYVLVKRPGHPNADNHGYVREHVLVMSELLGRPLLPSETVHHRNGDKADNEPKNLELRTTCHPEGQAVPDMLEFCVSYLSRYAPELLSGMEISDAAILAVLEVRDKT